MASGRKNTLLQPTKCDDPKEKCVVCGGGRATVQLDTNKFTFGQLISNVIRAGLGFNSPSVIADSTGAEVSVCEREWIASFLRTHQKHPCLPPPVDYSQLYDHYEQEEDPCPYLDKSLDQIPSSVTHHSLLVLADESQGE
jgi:hypothetical protein